MVKKSLGGNFFVSLSTRDLLLYYMLVDHRRIQVCGLIGNWREVGRSNGSVTSRLGPKTFIMVNFFFFFTNDADGRLSQGGWVRRIGTICIAYTQLGAITPPAATGSARGAKSSIRYAFLFIEIHFLF